MPRARSTAGVNIGLGVAIAVFMVGGVVLALGPGRSLLREVNGVIAEHRERIASWAESAASASDYTIADREASQQTWWRLLSRVQPVENDSELTSAVGELFANPSVTRLQIRRRETPRLVGEEDDAAAITTELRSPWATKSTRIEEIPIAVSFRSRFSDLVEILDRLSNGQAAVRLEAVDLKREYPEIGAELELTWFSRVPEKGSPEGGA